MDDLIAALEAWGPMVSSGYEVPAAGRVMLNAIDALRAYAEREKELVEALDCLTSNVEHAWPALANLGPVANARAILNKHKAPA